MEQAKQSDWIVSTPTTTPTESDYLSFIQGQKELWKQADDPRDFAKLFLAADEKMIRIRDIVEQIANANVPVLITGESGTGKEVVARAIHKASDRAKKPFIAVNCAALPASLLETELFGHEKGSFTDAHQRHIGKFEQANGGTLLLDEVTEIDPALQAKLLRALQEKEIERVGGSGPIPIDCRIIATTNRDIAAHISKGTFRQDLYYRLYVIHMEIPALRDRAKDIDLLSQHFLTLFSEEFNKQGIEFTAEAKAKLQKYSWPGNVRELQNVVQRTVLMTSKQAVTADDIPIDTSFISTNLDWVRSLPIGLTLQEVETQFILATLGHHGGNRTHAAKTLGISLRTLRNKINEFTAAGIQVMAPMGKGVHE